jgi:hypothetical protein
MLANNKDLVSGGWGGGRGYTGMHGACFVSLLFHLKMHNDSRVLFIK